MVRSPTVVHELAALVAPSTSNEVPRQLFADCPIRFMAGMGVRSLEASKGPGSRGVLDTG